MFPGCVVKISFSWKYQREQDEQEKFIDEVNLFIRYPPIGGTSADTLTACLSSTIQH